MESAGLARPYTSSTSLSIDTSINEELPKDPWFYFATSWDLEDMQHQRVGNINERTFQLELVKPIYDALGSAGLNEILEFRDNGDFQEIVKKMHNSLWNIIKSSMLDKNGNIVNYSMRNEIARLDLSNLAYVFVN